jgi:hypothetical protein
MRRRIEEEGEENVVCVWICNGHIIVVEESLPYSTLG